MFSGFSLPEVLVVAVPLAAGTLIVVSLRESEPHRKWFYMFLVFYEMAWLSILDRLLALAGVPPVWRDGVWGVLFVPVVATFVFLYRHRHDPHPDDTASRRTVVEWPSAPLTTSRLGEVTNYNTMVRHGMRPSLG